MKIKLVAILLCIILMPIAAKGDSSKPDSKWINASNQAKELADQMGKRSQEFAKLILKDKKELKAELAKVKADLKKANKKLVTLKQELKVTTNKRSALADAYEKNAADMKVVEGSIRTGMSNGFNRMSKSPVTTFYPENLKKIRLLLKTPDFLGATDLNAYLEILFFNMRMARKADHSKADIIGLSGKINPADVYRAGTFFMGYSDGQTVGFLKANADNHPIAIPANSHFKSVIKDWISGESNSISMDITGGAALEAQKKERTLSDWIEAGGMLLYPILGIGLLGLLVAILKFVQLATQKKMNSKDHDLVFECLKKANFDEAKKILDSLKRSPAAIVLKLGLKNYKSGPEALDNTLQEGAITQGAKLERYLSAIAIFAAVSPLLGLLGTVTGMIDTFHTITVFGTSDPRLMSTGISEALVTTQAGLGVAIPLLLLHHLLRSRINGLLDDIDEESASFAAAIAKYNKEENCNG